MKTWTIGNQTRKNVDLHLDNETVSGLHACLTRTDDGRWIIEDKNSMNGTRRLVNGQWVPVTRAYVMPDERLRFGRAETTVRTLLTSLRRAPQPDRHTPQPDQEPTVPWRRDLTTAFSEIRSFAQLKKCVLFVPDLVFSPQRHILRCTYRHQPVNPFAFMLLGGLIYTAITASGLSISTATKMEATNPSGLLETFLKGIPAFVVPLTLSLIVNMVPYWVFRRFSPRQRSFDDFMRLTAVLSGMSWMLAAFVALAANEHMHDSEGAILNLLSLHDYADLPADIQCRWSQAFLAYQLPAGYLMLYPVAAGYLHRIDHPPAATDRYRCNPAQVEHGRHARSGRRTGISGRLERFQFDWKRSSSYLASNFIDLKSLRGFVRAILLDGITRRARSGRRTRRD